MLICRNVESVHGQRKVGTPDLQQAKVTRRQSLKWMQDGLICAIVSPHLANFPIIHLGVNH